MHYKKVIHKIVAFVIVTLLFSSCASKKSVLYFQDSDNIDLRRIQYQSPRIQANDIINIKVTALNPKSVEPYNIQNGVTPNASFIETLKLQGYLVSQEGNIVFPVLGSINVLDKTTSELEKYIKKLLIDGGHVNDPAVSVRLLNSKFTVLGEVNNPGTFTITENNITLLQALGYAGDLDITASRKDILVLRDNNGVQQTKRIDLTTTDWFRSEFYYIKQNDVIVVNPNSTRIKSTGLFGNASTVMSAISLILTGILITR